MARWPRPGRVKTRLTPPLRPDFTCRLYEAFLGDVLHASARLPGLEVSCLVEPGDGLEAVGRLGPSGLAVRAQRGADLAERMITAVEELGGGGARPVILRNSDSPHLPGRLVTEAKAVLQGGRADAVFGPDRGGGYYLVALARPCPELFQQVPMSTATMYQQTRELAERRGLRVHELAAWLDVDEVGDLVDLARELACSREPDPCPRTRAVLRELVAAQRSGSTQDLVLDGATLPRFPDPG